MPPIGQIKTASSLWRLAPIVSSTTITEKQRDMIRIWKTIPSKKKCKRKCKCFPSFCYQKAPVQGRNSKRNNCKAFQPRSLKYDND